MKIDSSRFPLTFLLCERVWAGYNRHFPWTYHEIRRRLLMGIPDPSGIMKVPELPRTLATLPAMPAIPEIPTLKGC